jgi:hypothetical protein
MGVLVLVVVLWFFSEMIFKGIARSHPYASIKMLRKLFWYHLAFAVVYYIYAVNNPSDSIAYYQVLSLIEGSWLDTMVIRNWGVFFMAYPFKAYFDFSYEMCMLIFSWFGFIGFVFTYLFFTENIKEKIIVFKRYDLLTLLLFLPNMHFWSASLGKGSVIFMGIMMFIYAVRFPKRRIILLILGCFFIYCIRPHVMFFMIVGVIFGTFFGADQKLSVGQKFLVIVSGLVFIYLASSSILAVANLEQSNNLVDDFTQFASERSEGLSEKAGSGVEMLSYPLPLKLFTFWFRPLFVDVPNVLGIFSSMENLLYLLLTLKICNKSFLRFIKKAPSVVKMSAMIFLLTSFAMTFVMSNLGIIMRQKSMVMYFLFFVVYYYLADEKIKKREYWQRMEANSAERVLQESRELIN